MAILRFELWIKYDYFCCETVTCRSSCQVTNIEYIIQITCSLYLLHFFLEMSIQDAKRAFLPTLQNSFDKRDVPNQTCSCCIMIWLIIFTQFSLATVTSSSLWREESLSNFSVGDGPWQGPGTESRCGPRRFFEWNHTALYAHRCTFDVSLSIMSKVKNCNFLYLLLNLTLYL